MSVSKMKIKNLPRRIKNELSRREKILIDFQKYLKIVENGHNDYLENLWLLLKSDLDENIIKMKFFEEKMATEILQQQLFIQTHFLWNAQKTRLGTVRINQIQIVEIIAAPRLGWKVGPYTVRVNF